MIMIARGSGAVMVAVAEVKSMAEARSKWVEIAAAARLLEEDGKARLIEAILADFGAAFEADSDTEALLTRPEAMRWSRYSPAQFRKLEVAGKIQPVATEDGRLYRRDDLPRRPAGAKSTAPRTKRPAISTAAKLDPERARREIIRQSARRAAQRLG